MRQLFFSLYLCDVAVDFGRRRVAVDRVAALEADLRLGLLHESVKDVLLARLRQLACRLQRPHEGATEARDQHQ